MCHRQENCFMNIPYRVRRGLQRFFVTAGVLTLLAIVALAAWMLWLNRYVIYTDEGAKLDFGLSFEHADGEIAQPPTPGTSIPISYGNTDELINTPNTELAQIAGCTITTDMLTKQLSGVQTALEALPAGSVVLLDVKNIRGEFYYSSALGRTPNQVDTEVITKLIQDLKSKGCYLIARIPAFRDYWYFIDDQTAPVPHGLSKANGRSLWEDKSIKNNLHYWFNPASTGTQNFLVQIITELSSLGFDEVVLSDFRFPNTEDLEFTGDKTAVLNQAAKTLVQACATDTFAVSFVSNQITLPEGRCRLYFENADAGNLAQLVTSLGLEDPASRVVFLTDLMDTRYDQYSVLRPLEFPSS